MTRIAEAWRDPDKRRALLLSVAIHLVALLLLAVFVSVPKPRKLDHYLVITLGSPQKSQSQTQAPAAEAPAPQAPQPQVASGAIGEPQARSAPKPRPQAPHPQQATAQPPEPAQPRPQAPTRAPQPKTPPPVTAQAPAPKLSPPSRAAPVKPAPTEPTGTTAATLPEIKPVQLPPNQPPPAITIPKPQAQAEVPQAMALAITPQTHVSPARKLPSPQASAQVAQAQPVPRPQASASVARTLSAPQAQAEVTPAQQLSSPQARAQVTPAQSLQAPQATAHVAAPQPLSAPQASASVAAARPLPSPQATATAGTARSLEVTPQVRVSAPVPVPVPTIRAQVLASAASAGAPSSSGAPPGNTDVASTRAGNRTPGGNAPTAGQVGGTTQANAAGRGSATSPNGSATGTGVPAPSPAPFREELERPLAVLVDNVHGYPQSGLTQAASIIEMPVEGGLTRLMLIYDTADPGKVGPIRSARDYFVKLSESMHAVLVHDGGSPGAMIAIKKGKVPTLDALHRGDLFSRGTQRKAPYNLYSQGNALRRAVNRLLPARTRVLTGTLYRPPQDAPTVISVTDRFSSVYKTGFRYFPKLDSYRWVRNGKGADDASGENVMVDAVVVAKITARPLPDDPEGRLYIPLKGGPATLYLHGRAVAGRWDLNDGVQFVTAAGQPVDLAPFRTWFVMTPTYDSRVAVQ